MASFIWNLCHVKDEFVGPITPKHPNRDFLAASSENISYKRVEGKLLNMSTLFCLIHPFKMYSTTGNGTVG